MSVGSRTPLVSRLDAFEMPGRVDSIVDRWTEVVRAIPDREALVSPGRSYTFSEADRASDVVAAGLQAAIGADSDEPVGLLVEHSAELLIAALGVMKAGRIVVTLDSHMPSARLDEIIGLAGIRVAIADVRHAELAAQLGSALTTVLPLQDLRADDSATLEVARSSRGGGDAAVIVFTSGSTGRPKGVVETHAEILNDALAGYRSYGVSEDDRFALVYPFSFAAGVITAFTGLLFGAGLHLFDPRDHGARATIDWVESQGLTAVHGTPHLLRSMVAAFAAGEQMPSVRLFSTAGEPVTGKDVLAIRPHLSDSAVFVNALGSSEMGVVAFKHIAPGDPVPDGTVPAGRMAHNKDVLILREDGSIAAAGEPGSVLAVSDYLSGGYWKNPEEDAKRFGVADDGRRTCLQGDLGKIDEHGDLVLLGRSDAAVKIRGYLVEPSEIEDALLANEKVAEVLVLPVSQEGEQTRLIAYVVQKHGERPDSPAAVRRRLRQTLPEYMVPGTIVPLESLPRNERGKVDRRALPSVEPAPVTTEPLTAREEVVAAIWEDVLGLDSITSDSDFMALGGDSLATEEMLAVVQHRLGVELVSTDLIEAPTLREFTRRLEQGRSALPSHPDMVALNTGTTGTPIFCFTGAGSLAMTYLPIARHFADHDVYAFQAHGIERRALPDRTVEATATRYLELIRVVRPHGPYVLVGHSFGGLVALEIARRLAAAGECVATVGLLDTYLPRSAGEEKIPEFEKLPTRPSRLVSALSRAVSPVRAVLPDGLPGVEQLGRQTRARLAGVVRFRGQRQFDAFFDNAVLVTRRHTVIPYVGQAFVVLADENPDGQEAWTEILPSGPHIAEVPAEHTSLLREPHASTVAGIIRERIEDAGA